jgi:uncharacterized protein (TIGR02145 family)
MAENLNTNKFRNGDTITQAETAEEWKSVKNSLTRQSIFINDEEANEFLEKVQPAWCYDAYKQSYLYNYKVINDTREVCPVGWHIPRENEWTQLYNYLEEKRQADYNAEIEAQEKEATRLKMPYPPPPIQFEALGMGTTVSLMLKKSSWWIDQSINKIGLGKHFIKRWQNKSGFSAIESSIRYADGGFLSGVGIWWLASGTTIELKQKGFVFDESYPGIAFPVRCIKN